MIHLGVGSVPDKLFRGFDYAANALYMYTDNNYTHYDPVAHPQLDGIFFYDKGVQPSDNACIASIISAQHGNITPQTFYQDVAGWHSTGNA